MDINYFLKNTSLRIAGRFTDILDDIVQGLFGHQSSASQTVLSWSWWGPWWWWPLHYTILTPVSLQLSRSRLTQRYRYWGICPPSYLTPGQSGISFFTSPFNCISPLPIAGTAKCLMFVVEGRGWGLFSYRFWPATAPPHCLHSFTPPPLSPPLSACNILTNNWRHNRCKWQVLSKVAPYYIAVFSFLLKGHFCLVASWHSVVRGLDSDNLINS